MRGITINDTRYVVPENWDELTTKDLLFLADMYLRGVNPNEIQIKMLFHSLGAHVKRRNGQYLMKIGKKSFAVTAPDVAMMAGCFAFLFTTQADGSGKNSEAMMLDPRLVKNPFPTLGLLSLKGPSDALTDLRYEQFIYLQTYAAAYAAAVNEQSDSAEDSLNMLIASMYYFGEFDALKMRKVGRRVARLPIQTRIVVYWYYLGCMRFIAEKFPKVFERDESGVVRNMFDAQMRMVDILAEGDVTRKDKVRKAMLYDVLYTFEGNVERAEEIEKMRKQ
jgi:hypothetical protein